MSEVVPPSLSNALNSSNSSAALTNDPYFLASNDNSGQMLVQELLNGDNYTTWSRAMMIALIGRNKEGFVNGDLLPPIVDPTNEAATKNQVAIWKRNNNVVISWLINSVTKDISASILYTASAREIWLDLQERFGQTNRPRIFL